MEQQVEIFYTETFSRLTDQLIDHLALFVDESSAIEKVLWTISQFENRVVAHPLSCQISPYLAAFGIHTFREFLARDCRILYRVIENTSPQVVYADAILSQKQDLEKLLNDHCLIYTDVNPNQLV